MAEQNIKRLRSTRKKIKVTFDDGTIVCHNKVKMTMVDVLRHIGVERFPMIDLTVSDTRLVTRDVPEKYKEWNEHIADGWYLITQSVTEQKYMQLKAINTKLDLGMKVEIGEDFETTDEPPTTVQKRSSKKDNLLAVQFPDGTIVRGHSVRNTFELCAKRMGLDAIKRKNILWAGRPVITSSQQYRNQERVDSNTWLYIPATQNDCTKLLRVMGAMLRQNIKVGTTFDFMPTDRTQTTEEDNRMAKATAAPTATANSDTPHKQGGQAIQLTFFDDL